VGGTKLKGAPAGRGWWQPSQAARASRLLVESAGVRHAAIIETGIRRGASAGSDVTIRLTGGFPNLAIGAVAEKGVTGDAFFQVDDRSRTAGQGCQSNQRRCDQRTDKSEGRRRGRCRAP